ncbi:hypothetical protein [Mycoplasma sp. CSL7503-lung]|uniref:hypothetical protein n=1 Tax=Mycoplasma sp. CSL7503-lung TaxID=536372 RepID=UPI0021CEE890|nr:hypothetical protein [Mycoplasma sp. CSL7503-lung]MCU4706781.1 hypothetical protein [Mycoplasma sp. CSL7503-lung]
MELLELRKGLTKQNIELIYKTLNEPLFSKKQLKHFFLLNVILFSEYQNNSNSKDVKFNFNRLAIGAWYLYQNVVASWKDGEFRIYNKEQLVELIETMIDVYTTFIIQDDIAIFFNEKYLEFYNVYFSDIKTLKDYLNKIKISSKQEYKLDYNGNFKI